jgi:hypothetical protein
MRRPLRKTSISAPCTSIQRKSIASTPCSSHQRSSVLVGTRMVFSKETSDGPALNASRAQARRGYVACNRAMKASMCAGSVIGFMNTAFSPGSGFQAPVSL